MAFLIRDRLSWLRFLGFDFGRPDAGREHDPAVPRKADPRRGEAIDALFTAFDRSLYERGYLPMDRQIVDATLVTTPKQRNSAAEIWPDEPAKAAQKDRCATAPTPS
ncbi:hypothetical protein Q5H91_16180 [Sphingomonas sp. KR1UV-12]|uniref:Transposase InsH N-terminal domain-containing protein n=1 Tax=Sphingomonas aurea TaxID=3063994 RepID=A0ABT9EP85_9SPHN|nr:hypothetical protein [Sphingomonas sp. KR1UV-12]MDP1028761.1 hypothetical protein [Sphingomonas sp. KR1UV-12]